MKKTFVSPFPFANFLWNRLKIIGNRRNYHRVLDIGTSTFYNRELFHTEWYIGLDISQNKLNEGIQKYPDDQSFAILANIGNLPIYYNCADLVVCTYVLTFIPPNKRIEVIRRMVNYVKESGTFFIQFPTSTPIEVLKKELRPHFKELKICYYHSPFSDYYGRLMKKLPFLNPIWNHPFLRRITTFLCETLYPNISRGNKAVYIIGVDKVNSPELKQNTIPALKKSAPRLFKFVDCPLFSTLSYSTHIKEIENKLLTKFDTWPSQNISILFIGNPKNKLLSKYSNFANLLKNKQLEVEYTLEFNKINKIYDFVVVLDFEKRTTIYFHYHLLRLAKQEVVITHHTSKAKLVYNFF